jgi:hypothetical protein
MPDHGHRGHKHSGDIRKVRRQYERVRLLGEIPELPDIVARDAVLYRLVSARRLDRLGDRADSRGGRLSNRADCRAPAFGLFD